MKRIYFNVLVCVLLLLFSSSLLNCGPGTTQSENESTEQVGETDTGSTTDAGILPEENSQADTSNATEPTQPTDAGNQEVPTLPEEAGPEKPVADSKPQSGDVASIHDKAKFKIKHTKDIVYGKAMKRSSWGAKNGQPVDLKLDVFEPIGNDHPKKPVVVVIHGGGFTGGSKEHEHLVAIAKHFAERGWVSFSISYSLQKDYGPVPEWLPKEGFKLFPAGRDAKAAIRWVRANAEKYKIHPNYISAIGGSAGAGIAIGLGLTFEDDYKTETASVDPTLKQTNLNQSSKVQIVVNNWGGTWLVDIVTGNDKKSRYSKENPPMLTFHGAKDPTVDVKYAYDLEKAYKQTGVPYEMHIAPNAGHGAWRAKFNGKSISEHSFAFIVKHLKLKRLP